MTLHQFALFSVAFLIAAVSPGPGVAAVVARSLMVGVRRTSPFIVGMVLGDLTLFTLAILGLAALAAAFDQFFTLLRLAGAGYLIVLGIRAWTAPAEVAEAPADAGGAALRSFAAGLALTLSNPKTIVFYMALLPAFLDVHALTLPDGLAVAAIIAVGLSAVMLGYSLLCDRARHLFRTKRAVKALNRTTGGVMIGAGVAVAVQH